MASPDSPPSDRSSDASEASPGPFSSLRPADLRGTAQLATEATLETTRLVEAVHASVLACLKPGSTDVRPRTAGLTGWIYRTVRRIARLSGYGTTWALGAVEQVTRPTPPADAEARQWVLSALNGVLGDHLAASGNPLARSFSLRTLDGRRVDGTVPDASVDSVAPADD